MAKLKKKQQELEDCRARKANKEKEAANNAEGNDDDEPDDKTKNRSTAQIIYSENRVRNYFLSNLTIPRIIMNVLAARRKAVSISQFVLPTYFPWSLGS